MKMKCRMPEPTRFVKPAAATLVLLTTCLASAVFFLLSCSSSPETTLERAKRLGVVRVGYSNDVPFAYINRQGRLTGEAPEIARKILARMGIGRMEGVMVEFAQLIPALRSGRIDMISAMMFITPERCGLISFSEPTCGLGQGFFVKAGNPLSLHSYEDLVNNPKAVFCAMESTAEEDYAKKSNIPASRIVLVPDTLSGIEAVKTGKADAFAVAGLTIQILINELNDPGIEMAQPFSGPVIDGREAKGYGAYGFRKQDSDFLDEFNRHLKNFLGSSEHLETIKPFGFTEKQLPGSVSSRELCSPPSGQ